MYKILDKVLCIDTLPDTAYNICMERSMRLHLTKIYRRVSRAGAQVARPPLLEIEKQKKKEEKVIRANFNLFHLYFATFSVGNIIFSAIF